MVVATTSTTASLFEPGFTVLSTLQTLTPNKDVVINATWTKSIMVGLLNVVMDRM